MDQRARLVNAATLMVFVAQDGATTAPPTFLVCSALGDRRWPHLRRTYIRRDGETPDALMDRAIWQVRQWKFERGLEHPVVITHAHGAPPTHAAITDQVMNLRSGLHHVAQYHGNGEVRVAALGMLLDSIDWSGSE